MGSKESCISEGFRLSPQQRHAWRLHREHREAEFGVQCMVEMHGPIDVNRIDKAIALLRSNHEILRTTFRFLEGTAVPVQAINESATGLDEMIDLLCCEDGSQQLARLQLMAQEHRRQLREPDHAPVFRFALAALQQNMNVLLITASALCADANSLTNLVREIQTAYAEDSLGEREILQYADLSEWQNQLLENADTADQSPYWKSPEFSDLSFPQLPFELRESNASEFQCNAVAHTIRPEAATALNAIAERSELPLEAVLLTAWEIILCRFSGKERFLVGVAMDGRVQAELVGAIGRFVKFLPLSVHIAGNPRFGEVLEKTHASLKIARYDQLLFEGNSFGIPNSSKPRYLFPVVFSSWEQQPFEIVGQMRWVIKSMVERLEPFELSLTTVTTSQTLRIEFAWAVSVFTQTDIELLANSYIALLDEIAEDSDRRVSDFNMTPAGTATVLLTAPVEEAVPWTTIQDLIQSQARRVPEQLAVVCEDEQITYAELCRRASVLANRLEMAGVSADSVVALVSARSVDFIVGILAALKANAAWLPIEPDTPAERVEFMIGQAQAVAVLTQRDLARSADYGTLPVIYLDEHQGTSVVGVTQSRRAVHPHQLAYVIFTSGSTGQPKGVAIEHRQIAAYVRGLAARVNLCDSAHFALVSTLAADLGHTVVFASLTSGGCLHIIPAWRALDPDALVQYFLLHSIDFVKIVPAHLEAICRSLPESARLPWRYLFVGGELLTWSLVQFVQGFAPDCTVLNHYGPTETTVGVFCGPADPESDCFRGESVPIGRPLGNTSGYLLNEQLQPVSPWMPGDLYIGGDFVGRGYVGRGDLTADRFIPDPFHFAPGSRMYRTGDRARYRSDGLIEFLGRRDGQIKIRGYRVEIGEVETVLRCHPDVRNVAVVVADDPSSGKHLVAWVAVGAAKVKAEDLRSFVERSLPHYMVPRAFVCVDHLKLTPNGKVDRQALPAVTALIGTAEFRPAIDDVEENLVAVWRTVLGAERIGVEDNYFSLGGDSLRVIQLVHEARRYGITISATDVLRYQTIRGLRTALRARGREELFPSGIPPLALRPSATIRSIPANVEYAYPVSGIQTFVLGKYLQNLGSQGIYHIQSWMQLHDDSFSLAALEKAFEAVVNRHPALRTLFDLDSSPAMQWVCRDLNWKVKTQDISHLSSSAQHDHVSDALRADRANLFNCRNHETPLFRVMVFIRSVKEFDLVFSCHHAIMDGWGHRVVENQLVEAYLSIKSGTKLDLGTPDTTYREFVAFQDAVQQSNKATAFWKNYLAGVEAPAVISSAPLGPAPDYPWVSRRLEPKQADALDCAARGHSVSMQALMLSGWMETLRVWSGEERVSVGVVVNGRSEHFTDPLSAVGLFWNIVPVVSRRSRPLLQQAAEVQRDLIEMEPYSAYPLPRLLADQRQDSLFSSAFRYLNFWNAKEIRRESGLRLLGYMGYDCYSFPLTCTAVIYPNKGGGYLEIQYDWSAISKDEAEAMLNRYVALVSG